MGVEKGVQSMGVRIAFKVIQAYVKNTEEECAVGSEGAHLMQ
jgi:hypothetical protein